MRQPDTPAPLLSVDALSVAFPGMRRKVVVVDEVSLRADRGQTIGIVGESGSGKSMTALAIMQLLPIAASVQGGTIKFDGRDLAQLSDRERREHRQSSFAMIFQDAGSYLNPVMNVGDQIAEAIGRRGSRRSEDRQKVLEALRAVQIADPPRVASSYPHELSGGMQQRVMIAAALIRRPDLIIADEPTTALDATVQHQILEFLGQMNRDHSMTMILISHDLEVVSNICDRVYVMYAGQVVEEAATAELFTAPKHPYTQALLNAILDPFEPRSDVPVLEGAPPDMAEPPTGCRFHPRCPRVFAGCDQDAPDLREVEPYRRVRCRLYSEAAPS